ncbi:o-succinylbenzoate synthase [Kineococcus sp. NUM-3379]
MTGVRPDLADVLASAAVVRLPLRTRFRGLLEREAVLLRGPAGWGEFAPFDGYGPPEAARWLAAALEAAWQGPPPAVRGHVPVNATVPAVPAAQVPQVLARFEGCTTAKVKVAEAGQFLADDVARVRAVREVLGASGRIRVDANGAWSVEDAARALAALAASGLEYAEQPCADLADMARLRVRLARDGVDVPLAADESIRRAEDPLRVSAAGAADVVVLKVAPLGGVRAALAVAQACGLPVVVSSALDTSVGLAAGAALAGALPGLPFACGLGTAALLAADVTSTPLLPRAGSVPVTAVAAEPALLAEHAAPPERQRAWRERIAACWELLPR